MNNWIAREKALFCINCEVIFEASRCCPRCQSNLFLPLSNFQGLQDQDQDHQSDEALGIIRKTIIKRGGNKMSEFTCAENHLLPSSDMFCTICRQQGKDDRIARVDGLSNTEARMEKEIEDDEDNEIHSYNNS